MFEKIISLFSGGIIKEVGEAIDRNSTSDEERLTLKNELAKIMADAEAKMLAFSEVMEKELTSRHQADMASDSWLAKNIRPAVLIFLTLFTLGWGVYGIAAESLRESVYNAYFDGLLGLDMVVYGFYFGSRGLEKVAERFGSALKR